jgi:hypothetical protein
MVIVKYLGTFFLAIFCAFASLAAANDLGVPAHIMAQTVSPTNGSPIMSEEINSECFTGYVINFRDVNTALDHKNIPFGYIEECFDETAAIPLHIDGDKIIWSFAPSLDRFSLNPIDDIKNLQVVLKYRF